MEKRGVNLSVTLVRSLGCSRGLIDVWRLDEPKTCRVNVKLMFNIVMLKKNRNSTVQTCFYSDLSKKGKKCIL